MNWLCILGEFFGVLTKRFKQFLNNLFLNILSLSKSRTVFIIRLYFILTYKVSIINEAKILISGLQHSILKRYR